MEDEIRNRYEYESICVHNPLRSATLIPSVCDYTYIEIPLRVRIKRIILKTLKVMLILLLFIAFITVGTILIIKYCPDIYPIYLLFVLALGWTVAELITD